MARAAVQLAKSVLIYNACAARIARRSFPSFPFTIFLSVDFWDLAMPFDGDVTVFYVVLAGGTLLFVYLSWSRLRYDDESIRKRPYGFPPSPPTNTIMGHRLPTKKSVIFSLRVIDRVANVSIVYSSFLTTASWIEQYGPLISLRAGTNRYVVIGRYKASVFACVCRVK
jgi:hypothetical protein